MSETDDTTDEVVLHDEAENSIAVRRGHMHVFVFHIDGDELRYNGGVNTPVPEMDHYDAVPKAVVEFAEEYTDLDLVGDTEEQRQRVQQRGA